MAESTVMFPCGLSAWHKAGLLIAHPGHELRILGWLAKVGPRVCVLTDGSGHGSVGRMPYTNQLIEAAGAIPGVVFGRFRDQHLYDLLLASDHLALNALATEIVEDFERNRVDYLVSDAAEGYNSGHDVCRLIAAVVARRLRIPHFEFPLHGHPNDCPTDARPRAITVQLSETVLGLKLAAAWDYEPLRDEVAAAFDRVGIGAFGFECLRPASSPSPLAHILPTDPFYERHGNRQVERGYYQRVICRADHLLPLAHYLDRHARAISR